MQRGSEIRMKKQILITLTSLFVGTAPFVQYTSALAEEAGQQESINPITTPEQFIEVYCSIKINQTDPVTNEPILDSTTNESTQKLIESANQDNYKTILEGNALLQTMPSDFQTQVRMLYAQKLEQIRLESSDPSLIKAESYDALVAQANQINEAIIANNKAVTEQESNTAPEDSEAVPTNPDPQEAQTTLDKQTDVQDSEEKAAEEDQNPIESEPSTEIKEENALSEEKKEEPENLEGQEDPEPLQEETKPKDELAMTPSNPVQSQPNLTPGPQILMASTGPGLSDSEANQAEIVAEPQENRNQTDVQPVIEEGSEEKIEETVSLRLADLSQPASESLDTTSVSVEAKPLSNPIPIQIAESTSDSSLISRFILDYVSDSYGNQYYSATQNNASRILSGMGSWSALSSAQRSQINAQLRANGGKSYQALVQEAQRISLSSYSSVSSRAVVRTSVNTHAGLYALVCSFSLVLIGWILKRRKSVRYED